MVRTVCITPYFGLTMKFDSKAFNFSHTVWLYVPHDFQTEQ
jgi:hypothetical protein